MIQYRTTRYNTISYSTISYHMIQCSIISYSTKSFHVNTVHKGCYFSSLEPLDQIQLRRKGWFNLLVTQYVSKLKTQGCPPQYIPIATFLPLFYWNCEFFDRISKNSFKFIKMRHQKYLNIFKPLVCALYHAYISRPFSNHLMGKLQ